MKKLRAPSFASKVNREEIEQGARELGITLKEHARHVVRALQDIAPELGL